MTKAAIARTAFLRRGQRLAPRPEPSLALHRGPRPEQCPGQGLRPGPHRRPRPGSRPAPHLAPRALRVASTVVLVLIASVAHAAAQEPAGRWEGSIQLPPGPLAVQVELARADEAWSGTINIPAQGARDLPLTGVRVDGASVRFTIEGVAGEPTFDGALNAAADTIAGTFTQGGGSFPFVLTPGGPAEPAGEAARAALDGFDEWAEEAIRAWKVPGMAIGVFREGEVVLANGYGVRDLGTGEPVDAHTLFAIGSATKAFTTFALGRLVDDGVMKWDDPAIGYLPGLRLEDEYATLHLTPRDMVTHRSGLPRHDLVWYNNQAFTATGVLAGLRHLEPTADLGKRFQYNNIMYVLAGHLLAELTGVSWEDAIREQVLGPLGMDRTVFSVAMMETSPNAARPYVEEEDTLRRVPYRDITTVGPAGSINSNVDDMLRWVEVQLSGGRIGGERLINGPTLQDMHKPHMAMTSFPTDSAVTPAAYGMGWFIDSYRGYFRVHHGGNIDGFSALVVLFPLHRTGFVILTNKNGTPLPGLVARHLADRVFGLDERDWSGQALARVEAARASNREARERLDEARVTGTRPAHDLDEYAAIYAHPAYGDLEITRERNALRMTFNRITAPLQHWHFEVFSAERNPQDPTLHNMRVQFLTNLDGQVDAVRVPFEGALPPIEFRRKPDARLSDPAYLARLEGIYELSGRPLAVSAQGDRLTLSVPGQPVYTLVPTRDDTFVTEGIEGYRARFTVPASGPATELTLIQPNGIFVARRVEE